MQTVLILATALLMVLPGAARAQDAASYHDHMTAAGAAYESGDWGGLNAQLDAAQKIRPYSLYVWKNRVLARELADRRNDALALVETVANRGLSMTIGGHEALDALAADPKFLPIAKRMKANMAPIGAEEISKKIADTGLLPEAYIAGRKNSYIGSVRTGKILRYGKDGSLGHVAYAPGGVFDLEIRGKYLWAAVNNQLAYENSDPDNKFAAIMIFNAKSGAPKREIRVSEPDALLGDLEVAKNGTAYGSDSITPRLFRLERNSDSLEVFVTDPRFANLQGIALDENNHRLFVADYLTGLFVVDTKTATVSAIENVSDAHLGGIDGLYYHDGDLIGIQNGTTPHRIIRIGLNDDGTRAETLDVLQQNLGGWNEPTHGAVVKGQFNYIATSNWPGYDKDGNLRADAELQPIRIMAVPLD